MKKTAVFLYPQFSEYELSVALSVLMQGSKPVLTVGMTNQPIRGESGLTCIPDTTIYDVSINEVDSLLLPGCLDIGALAEEQEVVDFIRRITKADTIIASISSSPYLLAKAGILKGKKYTVGLPKDKIWEIGVFETDNYSDDIVVQDGNTITARGRGFIEFGICLGKALHLDFNEDWYRNT